MPILLKSDIYQVIEIKKQTNSNFFKTLKLGDLLKFEVELKHNGTNTAYVKITNINTKEQINKSFNQLSRLLRNFELYKTDGVSLLPFEPSINDILSYTE